MKIRNKHNRTTIESSDLYDDGDSYSLSIIGIDKICYENDIFMKDDGWEEIDETTNEELIDLACLWLQKHQSEYIQKRTNGELYVSGACLTELRYYLNKMISSD